MNMSAVQEQKLRTMVPDEFICHRLQKKALKVNLTGKIIKLL